MESVNYNAQRKTITVWMDKPQSFCDMFTGEADYFQEKT